MPNIQRFQPLSLISLYHLRLNIIQETVCQSIHVKSNCHVFLVSEFQKNTCVEEKVCLLTPFQKGRRQTDVITGLDDVHV